jgi:hypothetical protein
MISIVRYPNIRPSHQVLHNIGHFFLAINPRAFRPEGGFEEDLDAMIDTLHAARRSGECSRGARGAGPTALSPRPLGRRACPRGQAHRERWCR